MEPHLAALVAASAVPDAPPAVLARCCSRLVSALDGPAEAYDLVLAARLVASIADRLEPAAAAALLDSVRSRVADPAVLDATARVMERTGRAPEAAALRTRALSLSAAGDAVGLLEAMVESATAAGLGEIAPGWLEEVLRACDGGLFGSEGAAIRHRALLALASVLALSEGTRARAREVVRGELDRTPADREALDLLVAIAGTGREASEAASRLRAAAASCRGQEAADLLARAAAIHSGLGLRRQAATYLEEALAAVPGDRRVADLLDAAYGEAGLAEERRALAARRLAAAAAPEERVGLLSTAARLAAEAGDLEAAGGALAELLELDPGDRDALRSARDLLARAGGPARLAAVLRDLDGSAPAPPDAPALVASAERALGQGDLGAATALLEMAVVLDPDASGARALLAGAYRASDRPDLAAALEG
ncbi:MAG: hypothetical protein FJ087_10275 [Deltaproteobacteria bacterium]|nr:hypothetical protein [Deltaproteobacteria bacterium]